MTETPGFRPPPPRGGMQPWLKWSLIGCSSCLLVGIVLAALGGYAFWQFIGKNVSWQTVNVSGKPDLPLTATAGQLLPPRVGPFVRTSAGKSSQQSGATTTSSWQGSYVAGAKRVTVIVMPTAQAQAARSSRFPFGAPPQQSANPNTGFHMTTKFGKAPMDIVTWTKPNWTTMVNSPDMVAMQFVQSYRPGAGPGK